MNTGILEHSQILELHAAILSANMSNMRSGLIHHIDPAFVASIKLAATPTEQILDDLSTMNTAVSLADGSVPLETWLGNAIARRPGRSCFRLCWNEFVPDSQATRSRSASAATVAQLRAVGASLARISLAVLARAGIWGSFPWTDKLLLKAQLVATLRELGVPKSDIDDAEGLLRLLVRYRLVWKIIDAAKVAHKAGRSSSLSPRGAAARCRGLCDFDAGKVPTTSLLREQFTNFESQEMAELLDDLEHFETNGEVKRPSILDKD